MKNKLKIIVCLIVLSSSLVGLFLTVKSLKEENTININKETISIDNKTNDISSINPMKEPNTNNNLLSIGLIILFSLTLSLSIMYLLVIRNNKSLDKIKIYILSSILLTYLLTNTIIILTNNIKKNNITDNEKENVILDESNIITSSNINLDNMDSDITITNEGTYTFTGTFTHSIIVDTTEEVNIILDNVNITNENTATIIGLNAKKITITLSDNSINTLSDNGNSTYDACIYSNAPLEFEGTGTLIVNGNQTEGEGVATETNNITFNGGTYIITSQDDGINAGGDGGTITINDGTFYINASGDGIDSNQDAILNGGTIFVIGSDIGGDSGIDTDDGYIINGGTIIALGTDMIELPSLETTQNVLALSLEDKITKDTLVSILKDDELIISFKASKSFKTLIYSAKNLTSGNYSIYINGSNDGEYKYGIYTNGNYEKGELLSINNVTTFKVENIINYFGTRKD